MLRSGALPGALSGVISARESVRSTEGRLVVVARGPDQQWEQPPRGTGV
jgi:hypothetical protein